MPDGALILERRSPRPRDEICRVLARELGLLRAEVVSRLRGGGGILADRGDPARLEAAAARLLERGVRARVVDGALLRSTPRALRLRSLDISPEGLDATLAAGPRLRVARSRILGIGVHGLLRLPPEPEGAKGPRRRRPRRPPAAPVPVGFAGTALSPRGRRLLQKIAAGGPAGTEFFLSLYPAEPFRPLRVERRSFFFSSLGDGRQPHSLDNFLLLLEDLLAYLPGAWNREAAERFLETLDPSEILCTREEELIRFDRWIMHWVRLESLSPSGAPAER